MTDGAWFLRGTAEEINQQLSQLTLTVPNDDHAIGTFALRTTATSELGNTGLRSGSHQHGHRIQPGSSRHRTPLVAADQPRRR